MIRHLSIFMAGLIFALGLGLSGMTDANKVIAFLNIGKGWDPSLAFVMVGAIGVHAAAYRLIRRRPEPWFDGPFRLPTKTRADKSLLAGAALFGAGWGLGGFCPGPGVVSMVGLGLEASVFVGTMLVGMLFVRLSQGRKDRQAPNGDAPPSPEAFADG